MTQENRIAIIHSAEMAIKFEFKNRHLFKGGNNWPIDNVRDSVKVVRRLKGGRKERLRAGL